MGNSNKIYYLDIYSDATASHVWKLNEDLHTHITLDNRFSREENRVSFASRAASGTILRFRRFSANAEYNSVKQLNITESSVESRASEARIPEPQFPSLLLFAMLHPRSRPHLTPVFRKDEAPSHLRYPAKRSFQNAYWISSSASHFMFYRSGMRIGLFADERGGRCRPVFWGTDRRYFGFLYIFIAQRYASIFPFIAHYATNFPICLRIMLCSLCQAQWRQCLILYYF